MKEVGKHITSHMKSVVEKDANLNERLRVFKDEEYDLMDGSASQLYLDSIMSFMRNSHKTLRDYADVVVNGNIEKCGGIVLKNTCVLACTIELVFEKKKFRPYPDSFKAMHTRLKEYRDSLAHDQRVAWDFVWDSAFKKKDDGDEKQNGKRRASSSPFKTTMESVMYLVDKTNLFDKEKDEFDNIKMCEFFCTSCKCFIH